ncbi:hypothetical protein Y032_0520g2845 [Ancylostoma ceylanicum]|uniref:Serine/threonine specific protein phosphatases domain-containing protein n=1 Tax=Ancylostoma ceylanicum TaxID=53326 RepID=A0A016WSY4_9BILA|nr:hypothetical protein Y032_0520g2845 [Ancylostoma ceylanicum]
MGTLAPSSDSFIAYLNKPIHRKEVLVIDDFCERFGLELIVRAHQMCLDGFWVTPSRRLLTLFSAPMYCNLYRNAGTVLDVDENLRCQLISMVPESRGCRDRVLRQNRLWDETVDYICERPLA